MIPIIRMNTYDFDRVQSCSPFHQSGFCCRQPIFAAACGEPSWQLLVHNVLPRHTRKCCQAAYQAGGQPKGGHAVRCTQATGRLGDAFGSLSDPLATVIVYVELRRHGSYHDIIWAACSAVLYLELPLEYTQPDAQKLEDPKEALKMAIDQIEDLHREIDAAMPCQVGSEGTLLFAC